ncbi:MAG TPA: ABC transporter ATP-binding protein [Candidatus Limnocylindrales bacterium]|nr:ABC transporter ATP-binding protein [Candidatus Limnocylindrales bacterium]
MTEPIVRCVGLRKRFPGAGVDAVAGVDLEIQRATVLSLVGPSGCGKTTTLRLIAGFERPDGGEVAIHGTIVSGPGAWIPPERRSVGFVFQDYALFPHLTVGGNVAFGLPRGAGASRRVAEMLELVGLGGLEDRRPHQLSGGQQQRAALARAMAREPDVLLLDEPFSNLHAELRSQMRRDIRDILRRARTTTIFVTHDQSEALFMGDLVAVQRAGRIEQVDLPEAIVASPATRFVAGFMGPADFLPARPRDGALETELGALPLADASRASGELEVLVRPDDITLVPDAGAGARVTERVFQGMQYEYVVRLPSGRTIRSVGHHHERLDLGQAVRARLRHDTSYVLFAGEGAVGLTAATAAAHP